MQKHYQNKPKFYGVYFRNDLPKINDGENAINLDKFKSIGTHWIALHVNKNNQPILTALELNIFQKKLKKSNETKVT